MNFLYVNYPSFIHPEIFPGVQALSMLRWYGLMYIFAFGTAYFLLNKQMKEGALDAPGYKATSDDIFSYIICGIVFLLIGARVGSCLIYDTTGLYRSKPWLIFWPFQNGKFTGLAGMSYHGGVVGGFIGLLVWCLIHKKKFWQWADVMCVAIPFGYFFGRLGNFLNGELFGRVTTMPWGMVFPAAERFSTKLPWVQEFCAKIGMDISNLNYVNLPRHPSQLYEAIFEGIVTGIILWLCRKHKKYDGQLGWMYIGIYGFFRFFIEYCRQPDSDMGFRTGSKSMDISEISQNISFTNLSTGQILCLIMIVSSIAMNLILFFRARKKGLSVQNGYTNPELKNQKPKEKNRK